MSTDTKPTLTVQQVVEAFNIIDKFIGYDKELKFNIPIATRGTFAINLRKLRPVVADFEKDRTALIKKYGQEADGKIEIKQTDSTFEDFSKEFADMANLATEITLTSVDIEKLGNNDIPIDLIVAMLDLGIITG